MSMFPSVGSTVTNVTTTKTGTAAKIDFSDGSSIYVKYEALILKESDKLEVRSEKPIVHTSKLRESLSIAKENKNNSRIKGLLNKNVVTNSNVSQDSMIAAKLRTESRIEKLSKKWDSEHPSGEAAYNAMNGK